MIINYFSLQISIQKIFILQDYLSLKLPVNINRELTKIRISSHPLLIEKGRYFRPKIKRENRLCSQCNQIEDEQHFRIHCT